MIRTARPGGIILSLFFLACFILTQLFFSMIFACISIVPAFATAPLYEWTKTMGGPTGSGDAYSVAIDGSGNIYTAGSFSGTVDFDPGPGVDNHTSAGSSDIFLTRVNADGSYAWTKTMGGTDWDSAASVALDASANIYISGSFPGTADFDPGTGIDNHTSAGGGDIFITRINADGSYAWTKTMGGTGTWEYGFDLAFDGDGNVYAAGVFSGTVDFDPGVGVDIHTGLGSTDMFLTRINADGSYAWTKSMGGGTGTDFCGTWAVAVDSNGNIYLPGGFKGTVDFDPGPSIDSHTSAGSSIFLTRINADGSYAWTKTMGGIGTGDGGGAYSTVAVDGSGNIYTTGSFAGTVDFDPGPAVDNHASLGSQSIFLTRINADGSYAWTKTMTGTGSGGALSVALDETGNPYITGHFMDTIDFYSGPSVDIKTAINGWNGDNFLTHINADGSYAWTKTMSGNSWSQNRAMTVDGRSIYLTGQFGGTFDFDPSTGVDNHTSAGTTSIFLTKFSQNRDDLLLDFGASMGLWARYNDSAWMKLHSLSPTLVATGDLDNSGRDEALAVFAPYGLYARYDNTGPWVRIHSLVPSIVATGDMDGGGDEVAAVFAPYGIYARYNNTGGWSRLSSIVPEQVVMADLDGGGQDDLIADFGAMGIWARYNNGAWTKIIGANAGLMATGDLDGNGQAELMVHFPSFGGIWTKVNNAGWTKLHALAPEFIVTADLDYSGKDEVIIDFGAVHGIWAKYNDASWTKLHAVSPDSMTAGDLDATGKDELVADFGAFGVYVKYNDGAWTKVHASNPELMTTGNLDGN